MADIVHDNGVGDDACDVGSDDSDSSLGYDDVLDILNDSTVDCTKRYNALRTQRIQPNANTANANYRPRGKYDTANMKNALDKIRVDDYIVERRVDSEQAR